MPARVNDALHDLDLHAGVLLDEGPAEARLRAVRSNAGNIELLDCQLHGAFDRDPSIIDGVQLSRAPCTHAPHDGRSVRKHFSDHDASPRGRENEIWRSFKRGRLVRGRARGISFSRGRLVHGRARGFDVSRNLTRGYRMILEWVAG